MIFNGLYPSSAEFLIDSNVILGELDTSLFPGVGTEVKVHSGFRGEHAVTALDVINEVERLMVEKNTKNITVVRLLACHNLNSKLFMRNPGWTFAGGCIG